MAAAASTAHETSAPDGAHFTPAEVDLRGVYGGGLELEPPAARPSWFRRARAAFQSSVWAPVALKLALLVLGMIALAGVGIASILSGVGGVQVPLPGMMGNGIGKAWLASKPAASASGGAGAGTGAGAGAGAPAGASSAAVGGSGAVATTSTTTPSASVGMTEDGKVILNLATLEDLRHLPGVRLSARTLSDATCALGSLQARQ